MSQGSLCVFGGDGDEVESAGLVVGSDGRLERGLEGELVATWFDQDEFDAAAGLNLAVFIDDLKLHDWCLLPRFANFAFHGDRYKSPIRRFEDLWGDDGL